MPQSLCKIYLHVIFHIKTTSSTIQSEHLNRLHQYIGQLVNQTGCKCVKVGGTNNHVHILMLMAKNATLPDVLEYIKRNSSRWLKTIATSYNKFSWQGGYGVFSIGQSQADTVIKYIENQEEHHKRQNTYDEFIQFLKLYGVEYDDNYVLKD